jgi:hypothetical protein
MTRLDRLRISCTDHESSLFGIQWMQYDDDCSVPALVRAVAHVAFEVNDLQAALNGKKVIIPPNSPSPGVMVAFIEEAGAPVELLQIDPPGGARHRSTGSQARRPTQHRGRRPTKNS